jgi:hypothetical protein
MKYGKKFNPFGLFTIITLPSCLAKSNIEDSCKLLMGTLFSFSDMDSKVTISRKDLSKSVGWNLRKLDRKIKLLKDHKLIKSKQEDCRSLSTYTFLYHKIYDKNN